MVPAFATLLLRFAMPLVLPPRGLQLIVFAQNESNKDSTIVAVPEEGGASRVLVTVPAKEGRATQPELLEGGRHVLFNIRPRQETGDVDGQIVVQAVDGGPRVVLVENGRNPRRLSGGHLVYSRNGTLFAVAVDWNRFAVTSGAVPVLEGVAGTNASWNSQFAVSRTGSIVYRAGDAGATEFVPFLVDRAGREQPMAAKAAIYQRVSLSPDGRRVVTASGVMGFGTLCSESVRQPRLATPSSGAKDQGFPMVMTLVRWTLVMVGTAAYVGLAILGWGCWTPICRPTQTGRRSGPSTAIPCTGLASGSSRLVGPCGSGPS